MTSELETPPEDRKKSSLKITLSLPVAVGIAIALLVAILLAYRAGFRKALQENDEGVQQAPQAQTSPEPSPSKEPTPTVTESTTPGPMAVATPASPAASPSSAMDLGVDANGLSKATAVVTTNRGIFRFKFYPQDAPKTVHRFIELIQSGFYNGLSFHRVEKNFVVQGGDPTGTGKGGSGQKLPAEFNNRRHVEGTVAMARTSDPNSADSQFYITLASEPQLDHNYTVFGQVIDGMDVVRKLQVGDKMLTMTIE